MPSLSPNLRCVTLLSPLLFDTYQAIVHHLATALGRTATLEAVDSFEMLRTSRWDVAFVCGAHYVQLTHHAPNAARILAAPVLIGRRYQGHPWYFSDVVVRAESRYQTWEDLAGGTWGINERGSHSGYQVVEQFARERDQGWNHFANVVETGAHLRSIDMVLDGSIDAAAIDSHIFDVYRQRHRVRAQRLRSLSAIGPSTIPPIIVGGHIPQPIFDQLQQAARLMHQDLEQAKALRRGRVARLIAATDGDYRAIRQMWSERLAILV